MLASLLPSNFLTNFNNFLLIVLYFMIPWTAINLMDYFFVRKHNYAIRELFMPHGLYGAWSWRGLTAYVVGFAVMIPFMSTTIWEGPVAKSLNGGDISPFIGFPVAAILYLFLAVTSTSTGRTRSPTSSGRCSRPRPALTSSSAASPPRISWKTSGHACPTSSARWPGRSPTEP